MLDILIIWGIDKEFKKIGIDGKNIKHVLLTHSDVDHCGGVDKYAKNYIFPNAKVYIGKGEENYFGGAVCRMIKAGIPLKNPVRLRKGYKTVTDGEIIDIDGI
jgi:Metallo-beta-lactamase superfamily.